MCWRRSDQAPDAAFLGLVEPGGASGESRLYIRPTCVELTFVIAHGKDALYRE
jgi:hypothetical protein